MEDIYAEFFRNPINGIEYPFLGLSVYGIYIEYLCYICEKQSFMEFTFLSLSDKWLGI